MTERCKRNPCCGDYLDCKPPPQFKPRESYEEYQQRSALSPAPTSGSEAGGEPVAWRWRFHNGGWNYTGATPIEGAFAHLQHQPLYLLSVDRNLSEALATPAPSPAGGVREAIEHVLMTHTGLQFATPADAERFKARILGALSPATAAREG